MYINSSISFFTSYFVLKKDTDITFNDIYSDFDSDFYYEENRTFVFFKEKLDEYLLNYLDKKYDIQDKDLFIALLNHIYIFKLTKRDLIGLLLGENLLGLYFNYEDVLAYIKEQIISKCFGSDIPYRDDLSYSLSLGNCFSNKNEIEKNLKEVLSLFQLNISRLEKDKLVKKISDLLD